MNRFYVMLLNQLKKLKSSIQSISNLSSIFFQRKKTIDNMYDTMIQHKTSEIKILETNLKSLYTQTMQLKKEHYKLKSQLNKKNDLIISIQDLLTKRID